MDECVDGVYFHYFVRVVLIGKVNWLYYVNCAFQILYRYVHHCVKRTQITNKIEFENIVKYIHYRKSKGYEYMIIRFMKSKEFIDNVYICIKRIVNNHIAHAYTVYGKITFIYILIYQNKLCIIIIVLL